MANSDDMLTINMQAAIQAATAVVKVMMEADLTTELHTSRKSPEEWS